MRAELKKRIFPKLEGIEHRNRLRGLARKFWSIHVKIARCARQGKLDTFESAIAFLKDLGCEYSIGRRAYGCTELLPYTGPPLWFGPDKRLMKQGPRGVRPTGHVVGSLFA